MAAIEKPTMRVFAGWKPILESLREKLPPAQGEEMLALLLKLVDEAGAETTVQVLRDAMLAPPKTEPEDALSPEAPYIWIRLDNEYIARDTFSFPQGMPVELAARKPEDAPGQRSFAIGKPLKLRPATVAAMEAEIAGRSPQWGMNAFAFTRIVCLKEPPEEGIKDLNLQL